MLLTTKNQKLIKFLTILVLILVIPAGIGLFCLCLTIEEIVETGAAVTFTGEAEMVVVFVCGIVGTLLTAACIALVQYLKKGYELKYLILGKRYHSQASGVLREMGSSLSAEDRKKLEKKMKVYYRKTGFVAQPPAVPSTVKNKAFSDILSVEYQTMSDSDRFGYLIYELYNACASGAGYEEVYRSVFMEGEIDIDGAYALLRKGKYYGANLSLSEEFLASLEAAFAAFKRLLNTEDGSGEYLLITAEFEHSFRADFYRFEEELDGLSEVIRAMEKVVSVREILKSEARRKGKTAAGENPAEEENSAAAQKSTTEQKSAAVELKPGVTALYSADRHHRWTVTEDPLNHCFFLHRAAYGYGEWRLSENGVSMFDTKERALKEAEAERALQDEEG